TSAKQEVHAVVVAVLDDPHAAGGVHLARIAGADAVAHRIVLQSVFLPVLIEPEGPRLKRRDFRRIRAVIQFTGSSDRDVRSVFDEPADGRRIPITLLAGRAIEANSAVRKARRGRIRLRASRRRRVALLLTTRGESTHCEQTSDADERAHGLLPHHAQRRALAAYSPSSSYRAVVFSEAFERALEVDRLALRSLRGDGYFPAFGSERRVADLNGIGTGIDDAGDFLSIPLQHHHDGFRYFA